MSGRRKFGIALVVLGLLVAAGPAPFIEGYEPDLGLLWNLKRVDAELYHRVDPHYMNIGQFREAYPMYSDLPDDELTRRLHRKYFGYMDLEKYRAAFTGPPPDVPPRPLDYRGRADILEIRGDFEPYAEMGVMEKTVISADAAKYGLYGATRHRLAFRYMYFFVIGLGLVAFGLLTAALPKR